MLYANIPEHVFDDIVPIPEELTLDRASYTFSRNGSIRG